MLIKNPSNNTYSIRGTGALINNGYQDRKFLFITASHIYNSFEWDNNSQFVFHYKSLQCSPTTNGSLTIYVQGATNIIPTGQGHTDLKLVELKVGSGGNPLFASNPVSFLGWSIIDELSAVQGIHHPRGDVQKLFTGTNVQVYNETIGTGNYNYWKFDLASGVFEAVSSGSPILNVSKRLISTIRGRVGGTPEFSCGGANENAIGGRISASWPAFCQFLDPGNEGIVAINTIPYSSGTSVKVFPSATGPNNVCTSGSFTLTNAPLDIPISWEIIQGANLFSGSTSGSGKTATLNVLNQSVYGSARIRFTIQAMCGVKQYIKNFTVGKPNTTAGINGGTLVYSGSQVVYSISPVSGATSYNWQLPSGWSGGGNGLSNSITATVGSTSGNVTVIPVNSCGQGQPVILYVTVTSCQYCREYTLSPNPANEYLSIIPEDPKFGNKELFHLKEYQIFDMNGKLLQSSSTDMMIAPDQIKVADLPKGLYLVYLIFDDGVLVKKVIIDR